MAVNGTGLQPVFATALTSNDSTAKEPLGTIRVEHDSTNGDKLYMYILASGTIANGDVLVWAGTTGYTVKKSTMTVGVQRAAGVGLGAITDAYYGWMQIRGYHSACAKAHTGSYCTTAYIEGVVVSGHIRAGKYKNTTTWLTATTYHVSAGITPLESKATGDATVKAFIHCM